MSTRSELRDGFGLNDRQVDVLLGFFAMKERRSRVSRSQRGDRERYRRFASDVLRIELELKPGRRAVMHEPGGDRVEIRWDETAKRVFAPREVLIVADEPEGVALDPPPDLWAYQAAFMLRMQRDDKTKAERKREMVWLAGTPRAPKAGTTPDPQHYRRLLNRYDELLEAGSVRPVQDLAEEWNVNPNTMKSWIRRGRKYLREGE